MTQKIRYPKLEGLTDWLSAYAFSLPTALLFGNFWTLIGISVVLIVLFTFLLYRPMLKLSLYGLTFVIGMIGIIVFWQAGGVNDAQLLLLIGLSILHLALIFYYYRQKILTPKT